MDENARREADYNEFLYDDFPFCDTHPDRLATVAGLFGMSPAPATRCRVLELGCGLGGNIVPMAASLPEAEFVGIDASVRQVEAGLRAMAALGVRNLSLIALDIREIGPEFGQFDYIVCHGVFSWVPRDVQDAIFAVCRRHLAPQGVAYVSYNTLPGWHARGMLRDILRRHVPSTGSPEERVRKARAVTRFLTDHLPGDRSLLARWLKTEAELLDELSDAYVLYEHLVEINEPMWFREFAERALDAGLRYVGDVELPMMMPDRFGPEIADKLAALADSQIEMEQYLDLLSTRFFRRSLLCHEEVPLDRHLTWERLVDLRITSKLSGPDDDLDPMQPGMATFRGAGDTVLTTDAPLVKAALKVLAERRPADLPMTTLATAARRIVGGEPEPDDLESLGSSLIEIYAQGLVEFGRMPRPISTQPWPVPYATALARGHAAAGADATTNQRHESVSLDKLDRVLLPLCDGTHDREALATSVMAALDAGVVKLQLDDVPVTELDVVLEIVDRKLLGYTWRALLTTRDGEPEPFTLPERGVGDAGPESPGS